MLTRLIVLTSIALSLIEQGGDGRTRESVWTVLRTNPHNVFDCDLALAAGWLGGDLNRRLVNRRRYNYENGQQLV